jgi:hypothetical protein
VERPPLLISVLLLPCRPSSPCAMPAPLYLHAAAAPFPCRRGPASWSPAATRPAGRALRTWAGLPTPLAGRRSAIGGRFRASRGLRHWWCAPERDGGGDSSLPPGDRRWPRQPRSRATAQWPSVALREGTCDETPFEGLCFPFPFGTGTLSRN